jgi:hypothetical protein
MKLKLILLISTYSILLCFLACAKENELSALKNPYLGQTPPSMTAEVFAWGTVTTPDHEHSRMEFSKDGRMLFWTVMPVPLGSGGQRMQYVERAGTGWTVPAKPVFLDSPKCGSPTFSADGGAFYYIARGPHPAEDGKPGGQQLWRVRRKGLSWDAPQLVEGLLPVFTGKVTMAFCFAGNGNLYFDAGGPDEAGAWSWNIYVREYKDGRYVEPKKLGNGINASQVSWCPFISPDESYLIFSSDRTGQEDSGDLYICFRSRTGAWTEPVNMGSAVNTGAQERFPSVSPDGKYFFFARNMEETYSDIFWADAIIIEKLRPRNTPKHPVAEEDKPK